MKLNSLSLLCLLLLVFHIPFSLTKGGSKSSGSKGGWFGSSSKTSHSTKYTKSNTNHKKTQNKPQSTAAKQPSNKPLGTNFGYPQSAAVLNNRYSVPGGYPGGYVNQNPNNKILSPHYAGSFGYGGHQTWGGSPYSRKMVRLGLFPNYRSTGFGHRAAEAAAEVTMTRMALRYGLARFPRPQFHFHNSQQESHYNHYMYRKYGTRSNNVVDYSRENSYSPSSPAQTYDSYMKSCMEERDLPPAKSKTPQNATARVDMTAAANLVPESNTVKNTTKADDVNKTATVQTETFNVSSPPALNQSDVTPVPPASLEAGTTEDDDTVDIVEIGYPALIQQMKARRCLERYLDYSEEYMKRLNGRVQGLKIEFQRLLAAAVGTLVMLHNSNLLPN